jgi:tetratricopeptide (TPR) repeat protein
MENLVAKSINFDGKLVINNPTSEDCETLEKIQGISTELNAIEKGVVSGEEFNGLRQAVNELKNLLVKNHAHLIQAGDVQVSLTLLSLKHIIVEGNEYLDKRNYSMALDHYNQAIEIDPNYADAWNNKGIALRNLRKFKEAIYCCDMAIMINPNYADAWNNKGVSLGKLGKYKEAIESYDRDIKIDPNFAHAWNNKGNALRVLGEQQDANRCFSNAKSLGLKPS